MDFEFTTRMGYDSNYSYMRENCFLPEGIDLKTSGSTSKAALTSLEARDMVFFLGWQNQKRFFQWRELMHERYPHIALEF